VHLLRPRPLFVVKIRGRRVEVGKGNVPRGFVKDCERLVESFEVPDGTIRGVRRQGGVSLRFSRSLSDRFHQQFRNIWSLHA
jgi:hypothetical protein